MAENRKKKNQQKLPWWLTPVLLLAVLAIRFGGEALGRGFQWLSDSQTSESTTESFAKALVKTSSSGSEKSSMASALAQIRENEENL